MDENKMETELPDSTETSKDNTEQLNSSKGSDGDNLDAIKKFIEEHKPENEAANAVDKTEVLDEKAEDIKKKESEKSTEPTENQPTSNVDGTEDKHKDVNIEEPNIFDKEIQQENLAVASSVMDMILSQSEAKICEKKNDKTLIKKSLNGSEKSATSLSVGSKVQAKDFDELWHPAQIMEVDYEEMEVLVHYDNATRKHDEWISVSSPRLRPLSAAPPAQDTELPSTSSAPVPVLTEPQLIKEEIKVEKEEYKPKVTFALGERCLARWRDNRRFMATVSNDLGNGQYEIMFDDGVLWVCNVIRLSKLKKPYKKDGLTVDTTGVPATSSTPSPVYGPGPSHANVPMNPIVPIVPIVPIPSLNNHLFDPTRDYLGPKSERREMKRKLNIKEIFNIGQKKKKIEGPERKKVKEKKVVVRKAQVVRKKAKVDNVVADKKQTSVHTDAVASIIGTIAKEIAQEDSNDTKDESIVKLEVIDPESKMDIDDNSANSETLSVPDSKDVKQESDSVMEEEVKLEKFEATEDDVKHEEVIDRIKEAINKLEGGLKDEVKVETVDVKPPEPDPEITKDVEVKPEIVETEEKIKKIKLKIKKVKKVKKVRLLQEKKVKNEVEKVKNELEDMKKQMEEMRRQMSEELAKKQTQEMPETFLLPGEWCCKWVNGQPVGTVSELDTEPKLDANNKPALPRRSVQVEDKRLPPGWTKHVVRRSFGNSAGKWDVVLMSPDNRRFHTKTDMRIFLENNMTEELKPYESALMDFGMHIKLSRRMGWYTTTPDGEQMAPLPIGTLCTTSPLVKRKQLKLIREKKEKKEKKVRKYKERKKIKMKLKNGEYLYHDQTIPGLNSPGLSADSQGNMVPTPSEMIEQTLPLEDGFVYVGSLKVQIIENLLRCPAEGCYKNFRNNTLLKMHIKHYHRELKKMLGATPKVLDLAYARTRPSHVQMRRLKLEAAHRTIKVKLPKLSKKIVEPRPEIKDLEPKTPRPTTPVRPESEKIPRTLDSPKLRKALTLKPKRPKVLLPVRRPDIEEEISEDIKIEPKVEVPDIPPLDFETAISTHTVTKPIDPTRKGDKKKIFATFVKKTSSEDEEWFGMNSDVETRSSYPRSGTPDTQIDQKLVSSESNEEQKEPNYLYTENGERIKIVHMKREEIINCHCGFREEDGLMVQCELCLCWQHALCHNIQKESEVPEKYTCSICLNPRRGRRSQRFLHDQDRLYEGLLPGAKPCESLRRSHELSGNLHRIEDALHALRVKYYVATKKDHPKLYLWAKDWETGELAMTQEKLNSEYSDLSIMINSLGKENLPVRTEEMGLDIRTPPSEEPDSDRFSQKDNQLGSHSLLSGLLSSPGGASLDLPISTTELERLAKTVQAEVESRSAVGPQPEAAIENGACRERLLRHIQRCQAAIDARLDSIEAQVAELESQDPSFEDDETADYFPRTKNTIRMMMRDLDTMEELGVIT